MFSGINLYGVANIYFCSELDHNTTVCAAPAVRLVRASLSISGSGSVRGGWCTVACDVYHNRSTSSHYDPGIVARFFCFSFS